MAMMGLLKKVPPLVRVGAVSGALGGASVGVMTGTPAGVLLGLVLGVGAGTVAGVVMDRDDKRSSHRTRQLDDIIGVTNGSLGAPPSVPSRSEEDHERELRAWVTEWLTPPAPPVR